MGFRNPITTAEAVDTGRGVLADPGVRLFQDLSNPAVPRGIAEWRTGLMSRNATADLAGGGSGGSSFTLDGGATQNVSAPTLSLQVASGSAGGYTPRASLTRGPLVYDGKDGYATFGTPTQLAAGWGYWGGVNGYENLTFVRLPDGTIQVEGFTKYLGGTGATSTILTISGPYLPRAGHAPLAANIADRLTGWCDVRTDGALTLRGPLPNVGDFVAVSGSYASSDLAR